MTDTPSLSELVANLRAYHKALHGLAVDEQHHEFAPMMEHINQAANELERLSRLSGNGGGVEPLRPLGPEEQRWMIVFDDQGVQPLHFSGEGAERAAHRTYERMLIQWSCRLFKTIELTREADNIGSYEIGSGGPIPCSKPLLQRSQK